MIKRLMTMLACATLILLSFGQAAVAKEMAISNADQALEAAKKLLPEITAGKQFTVEPMEDPYTGKKQWSLDWTSSEMERWHHWLHIMLDAETGAVRYFSYQPQSQTAADRLLTKDQAREIALKFVSQMQPKLISQMRLEDQHYSLYNAGIDLTYRFNWKRIAHGVPVDNDGIGVTVDAATGQVVNYYWIWNQGAEIVPPTGNIKSPDEVLDNIINNLGVYPAYKSVNNLSRQTAQLVYNINTNTSSFDAYSGQPVDVANETLSFKDARLYNQHFTFRIDEEKTTAGTAPQQPDMAEAQRIAEQFFKQMGLQGKVRRSGSGGSSGPGYTVEYWVFSLEKNSVEQAQVDINRADGSIVGYQLRNESVRHNGRVIDQQQAMASAEKFLMALGHSMDQYTIRNRHLYDSANQERYRFEYVGLLNGVPNEMDVKVIEVDRYTGEVASYRNLPERVLKIDTDADNSIIDQHVAVAAYKMANPLKLSYLYGRDENYQPQQQAKLVYLLQDKGIDAYSGEPYQEIDQQINQQLNNHWAKEALGILAHSGLLPTENFNPDGYITIRQATPILSASISRYGGTDLSLSFDNIAPDEPLYYQLQQLVFIGMLERDEQINFDDLLTRETLAVWLVKGMGYKNMANLPIKIENEFNDYELITKDHRNYVALVAALGIINGDNNGNFNPHQPLTWGEFATIITRAAPMLSNRY